MTIIELLITIDINITINNCVKTFLNPIFWLKLKNTPLGVPKFEICFDFCGTHKQLNEEKLF